MPLTQISYKSTHDFLSCPANKQTIFGGRSIAYIYDNSGEGNFIRTDYVGLSVCLSVNSVRVIYTKYVNFAADQPFSSLRGEKWRNKQTSTPTQLTCFTTRVSF